MGGARPGLVCVPGFVGQPGAHQYARFAAPFRGRRDLSVLQPPGFTDGQLLPASTGAVVAVHAETVERSVDGAPFVLVGCSSGGLVAHALAAHLESRGTAPVALVLIDTYGPDQDEVIGDLRPALASGVLRKHEAMGYSRTDAWLTAMGRYNGFDWTPQKIAAPTLLVRASQPLVPWTRAYDWRSCWRLADAVMDVPGDHFTIMEEHAPTTARRVEEWLSDHTG